MRMPDPEVEADKHFDDDFDPEPMGDDVERCEWAIENDSFDCDCSECEEGRE